MHWLIGTSTALTLGLLCGHAALADAPQQQIEQPPAGDDNRSTQLKREWLHQFVGTWVSVGTVTPGEGVPPITMKGTMTARLLGNRWLTCEYNGPMPGGGKMAALQTIGFNETTGRYVGTWVDSSADYLWKYDGELSADGKTLSMSAEGPRMAEDGSGLKEGTTQLYRDSYTITSPDLIEATSELQLPDGTWQTFVTSRMKRVK